MNRTLALTVVPATLGALLVPAAAVTTHATAPAAHTAAAGAASVTPDPDHIKTLTAVLNTMTSNYAAFAHSTPGAQDILDYHIGDLWLHGIDGTGTTIAVLEGWDDPQINTVIHSFDQKYGLPDPEIQTIYPDGGHLPATCPPGMVALGSYGSCSAWAGELRLDVEAAHLIAPYAKIVISATPADSEITDDAASQVAPPEFMTALEYIAQNHLADAISISDGTGESTYDNRAELTAQDPGELAAAAAGIPVLVGTGDCGVVQNLAVASSQCGNTTTTPDTAAWDDSPWVTAMGGSVPDMTATGTKAGPDPLWKAGKYGEGAGYSSVYSQPDYQRAIEPGATMRSVPDITLDAQDGTSESTPLMAGVLALAAQLNHGDVGPANTALYRLGPLGARAGIADVVSGNNSDTLPDGTVVPGFTAGPGFDVASGWGSLDASKFVPALVAATRTEQGPNAPRQQAARALDALRRSMQLTSSGGSTYLLSSGFLPGHPVELDIDGAKVATLTANNLGTVTDLIDPSALGLSAGKHTVTLHSMLIDQTGGFRSR
jgi:subtilase family serine protease